MKNYLYFAIIGSLPLPAMNFHLNHSKLKDSNSTTSSSTNEDTAKTLDTKVPTRMTQEQVAQLISNAGFPEEIVPLVTCLAEKESHFRPNAVHHNTNDTSDHGLLQINDIWVGGQGACNVASAKELLNPEKNVACALVIYETQGLKAWSTYRKFKHTCTAYTLSKGVPDMIADTGKPQSPDLL